MTQDDPLIREPCAPRAHSGASHPASLGVIILNVQGTVCAISTEARKLIGLSSGDQIKNLGVEIPGTLLDLIERVQKGIEPASYMEVHFKALEAPIPVHVFTVEPGGDLVLVFGGVSGLLQHNWSQLDRWASLGVLAAGMAHEVKNALVPTKSFVDLLLEKEQGSELANLVRRELAKAQDLLTATLKFAVPAGDGQTRTKLGTIVDNSLCLVRPQMEAKGLVLERSVANVADDLIGNGARLEQAVLNLLLNAIDATPPGGAITLSIAAGEPARAGATPLLRLTIRDSGWGIAPENLPRLFEPFFTTKKEGTGLGLAITRHIIESHRGTITVESEPGAGAAFHVLLPQAPVSP